MKQFKLMKDVLRDLRNREKKKKDEKKKLPPQERYLHGFCFYKPNLEERGGRGPLDIAYCTCLLPAGYHGNWAGDNTSVRNASVCLCDTCACAQSPWLTGELSELWCRARKTDVGGRKKKGRGFPSVPRGRVQVQPRCWGPEPRFYACVAMGTEWAKESGEMLAMRKLTAWLALHNLGRTHCGKHD